MPATTELNIEIVSTPIEALEAGPTSPKFFTAWPAVLLLVLQAAAAIVTIVKGFKKEEYDGKVVRELNSIQASLKEILDELRLLKPWFVDIVDSAFRKDLEGMVFAMKKDFESELAFLPPSEQKNPSQKTKDMIKTLAAAQRSNTFHLQIYGPLAYIGIATASLSTISMWSFARSPYSGVEHFIREVTTWLHSSIDPNVSGSFGATLKTITASANAKKEYVEGANKDVWFGYYMARALPAFLPGPGGEDRPGTGNRPDFSIKFINWYGARRGNFEVGIVYDATRHPTDSKNTYNHPLSRIEGGAELHDADQSGRARVENLNQHFKVIRAEAQELFQRAADVQGHIDTIKKLIEILDQIGKSYK